MKRMQSGFTLIELVVVMAIVATLTAMATFNFNQARIRARDVQRKSELRQIQNALELFKNDQYPQRYPNTSEGLAILVTNDYMAQLPVDPRVKALAGSWLAYAYTQVDNLHYSLTACLENLADPDAGANCVGLPGGSFGVVYTLSQP